ncbi:hypothetical protein [Bartonella schoenbuchensis]|uniref:Uncharacterized protein n=1 Tax=Bartonella schoenbuchensis m07a TaxID=1094496 RepID=N6VDP4_9HYPH|nr:hypothetical protein [Bartonella schoenbuchensis]ENN91900.1 hypothetical protein m07a_07870 [Bartonella schoenbuchensis m07a]
MSKTNNFFGFFLPKISTFYASNKKLNNLLVSYYKEHFPQKKVIFKPTFINSEKFAEKLKIVKKIEMSINHDPHKNPDLVFPSKEVSDMYEAISEPFPRDDIIKIGLSVDLKVQNRNWIRNFFNNFLKNNKVENLRCIGKTQDNFDAVFNTEEFQQQVAVAVEKDENGLYKEDSIQKQIISQITKL